MSVQARSLGSAGRPVFGRPVAAVVAALIATFAIGAPTALAGETPGPGEPAADVSQTSATTPADPPPASPPSGDPPPADPPPADPPSSDPPPADPPPVDPPSGDAPPADPPPVDPPPTGQPPADPPPADPPATDPPPADSPGQEGPPSDSSPADPPPTQSPSGQPEGPPTGDPPSSDEPPAETPAEPAPPPGGNHSAAQNQSRVIQAVWQVQRGCRTHCHGTSQTQRSEQVSETNQRATAISGESDGGGSSAHARNESSTIQFVWQMQIGCVAFCFHTSQSQEASQQSYTTQDADAQSALTAWAENLAETVQYVFQIQQGCEHECHGVTQHQSSTQGQTTNQSATAEALGDGVGFFLVPDWLLAYAQNIGATIQLIYQYQEALCLEYCMGDAQLQEAIQHALTNQDAVALANPPVPAEPPPGEEPPGQEPAPGATTPGVVPETAAPVASARAAPSSIRQGYVLGRNGRRTVRRQELVLHAGARSTGGAHVAPDGPAAPVPAQPGGGSAQGGSTPTPAAAVEAASVVTTSRTGSEDDKRDARAAGDQLPAETFAVPSAPNAGGSLGWLLILLLTVAVAAVIGSLRRALETTMNRI
jgi:hypothetical protein